MSEKDKTVFYSAIGFVVGLFIAISFVVVCFPYMALAVDATGNATMMCGPTYEAMRT